MRGRIGRDGGKTTSEARKRWFPAGSGAQLRFGLPSMNAIPGPKGDLSSTKTATIRDVARAANVSVASASRAINGLGSVTEATRSRIVAAAAELRYVPNSAARSLATRRSDTIGVLLPDLYGEFFSEIIRGIDGSARSRGLHLLLSNSHGDAAEAAAAIQAMRGRVDGLIVMSPHVDSTVLSENLISGMPIVLINSPVTGKSHPAFLVDNYAGATAVVRHLAEGGRTVAHLAGPPANLESRERRRGYRDALGGNEGLVLEGDFSEESGYRAGRVLAALTRRPDAVFAANDMMAIGCLIALADAGVRAPVDIAIAGFDDIPLSRLVRPSLTTAGIDIAELGSRAVERLIETIGKTANNDNDNDGRPEMIEPRLVVRQSSAWKDTARTSAEKRGRETR